MAFYLQIRRLHKRVEQQIAELNDAEKSPGHRLSGATAQGDDAANLAEEKDGRDNSPDSIVKHPYTSLDGISLKTAPNGEEYYQVGWESSHDTQNPRNWARSKHFQTMCGLILIAFVATAASAIDSAVATQAAKEFHVSDVTESLATAMFLVGFGIGALLASPLSEMLGRYPVYVASLIIFGVWLMASALSPNIGAQIAFRFLAGLFSSAPLTIAGGTISDLFNAKHKTIAFPVFASTAFGGPVLGPVIAAYIGYTGVLSWRWADWIMLITDGLVLFYVLACMQETLSPQLLKYKAQHLRKVTGDKRFKTEMEAKNETLGEILKINFTRPFVLAIEPIVAAFTLYLSIIYIVLFTFLDGYEYIFSKTYGINQGLTYTAFLGLFIGIVSSFLMLPVVYKITINQLNRDGDPGDGSKLNQETRLWFAMIGAPAIPIGLFWMAWTDYSWISIWSPLAASVLIGFGIVSIFLSAYMYVIDSYEVYAASALTFVALVRYLAAGGMTVVGLPMYGNLGTHWTLTLLGCIASLVVPIPYLLYKFGPKIRQRSKYAVSKEGEGDEK